MLITTTTTGYITASVAKTLKSVTAATADEVYSFILAPHHQVDRIMRNNSFKIWHNERDMQDARAELVSYMASKFDNDQLLALFNCDRGNFNFWLVKYCSRHLKKKGFFYSKYTNRKIDIGSTDITECDYLTMHADNSEEMTLSLLQYQQVIIHFLSTTVAKKKFKPQHIAAFVDGIIKPIVNGEKKPKLKDVADLYQIDRAVFGNSVARIRKHLKICIDF